MSNLKPPIEVTQGGTGVTTLTGVLIGNGTSNVTGQAVTQYNALIGGASNAITSVAPGTTGIPLVSQGASANPAFSTAQVAGGGTGLTSYAAGDLIYASATNTLSARAITASRGPFLISDGSVPVWGTPNQYLYYYDDFVASQGTSALGWGTSTQNSGGSQINGSLISNTNPGTYDVKTNTLSNGAAALNLGNASMVFGGGEWYIEWYIYLSNLSDGTDTFTLRAGFGDTVNSDCVDGAYFEYTSTGLTPNWVIKTANNSVRSSTTTSTAVAATTWTKLGVLVNADATLATFYVNGTSVGTQNSNIPTGSGRLTGPLLQIVKSAGSNNRIVTADYCYFYNKLTAAR